MEVDSTNRRVATTTCYNENVVRRFLTAEGGVVANQGRLTTYDSGEETLLLSYTNEVIASITNDGNEVTLYTGHHGQVSQTTTNHIKLLGSILSNTEGKTVNALNTAPTMGVGSRASDSAQYISNYIGNFAAGNFSPVELDARETVERALQERLQQLF